MKVIRYHEKGDPDVLKVEEIDTPRPTEGEVLVKVEAVGVGYGDVLRRGFHYYPFPVPLPHIPGGFVAGTVIEQGEGVTSPPVGSRVYGMVGNGCAEFVAGPAAAFTLLPDAVSSLDAVAILSDGETASLILKQAGELKPRQTVFVPAAAGALGSVAVQLARLFGASKVFGGASSAAKLDAVLELGATAAFDYTVEGWSKKVLAANDDAGLDLALEMTGGPVLYETIELVRPGGRIVNYGNASDTDSPVNPRLLLRKNLTWTGFNFSPYIAEKMAARGALIELIAQGRLKASYATYPMHEAARVHQMIEARQTRGRQILLPHA